jgi:signal transduction histidine kinase/ActR/RegA family two-component response regulator
VLLVLLAWYGRSWILDHYAGRPPYFVTLYPAVALAALLGGFGPGIGATLLGAALAALIWMDPSGSLWVTDPAARFVTGVYLFTGMAISVIGHLMHQANARLRREVQEREKTERQLQIASAAKDRFIAMLSHELRTPLTPALLLADAMAKAEEVPQEVRDDLSTIKHFIEVEAHLVDDLLDLTRIRQNKLVLCTRPCDPQALLEKTETLVSDEIAAKKLAIRNDFNAADTVMEADPVRLQQVFWNVLKNAVKFSGVGGLITLSTQSTDTHWTASISDQGVGIPQDQLESIFEAFSQGPGAEVPHYGGLGLGLTICRHLVQSHHGRIWAESPGPGKGATFHIELPRLAPPQPELEREPALIQAELRPLRILLVEDDAPTRLTLQRVLQRRGHTVVCANSIKEGCARFAEGPVDLILSDIGLPDGEGHDLLEKLLPAQPRAIALSGFGMEHDVKRSREAGFLEHLTKPVTMATLDEAMARVMARRETDVAKAS